MWELDCEEGWVPKNWCFWTVVLEKTLESPLDYKEIQPVHFKGDLWKDWLFFGRTDAKAETLILWPIHVKSWLIGKNSEAGRDWGQEENGTTEDEMAGWHHWLDAHEFGWNPGVGDWQGGLACCDSWGHKESDTIELLNWAEATDLVWAPQIWTFSTLSCLKWVTWLKGTKTIYTHIETVYSNKIFLFHSLCQHKLTLSGNSCPEGESWSNYCLFLEVSKKKALNDHSVIQLFNSKHQQTIHFPRFSEPLLLLWLWPSVSNSNLWSFTSVQSLSCVRLFATPWTAAHQASLSITNSRSAPKPMSIVSVMPFNHLILCCPLLPLPSVFPSIRMFSNESALCIRWPKYWSFSFNISPSNEHPGLISFRMD